MLKKIVSLRQFFEYPQHMFWMRNKENSFSIRTYIWRPVVKYKTDLHSFTIFIYLTSSTTIAEFNILS